MQNKKIAASLDIGTNSTLFLIAEMDARGGIKPLHHDVRTNDLGRGLDASGFFRPETIDLNVDLLRYFKQQADEAAATEIRIAATEALRRGKNAHLLIDRVRRELGMEIRIIRGEEEARLTFLGILSGLPDSSQEIMAADIGGGSSEFVLGKLDHIEYAASLPAGAVVLDKQYIQSDPPAPAEIQAVHTAVQEVLQELPGRLAQCRSDLVICGGTASSLAAADLGLADYDPAKIGGHIMEFSRIEAFIREFSSMTLAERRKIPGIGIRRAEIILPGTIIIYELLKRLNKDRYSTSERGLRYGLLVNSGNANNFA